MGNDRRNKHSRLKGYTGSDDN